MISGDHVLPSITPHINGLGGTQDPLDEFVKSLDRVREYEAKVVLPAHGVPFHDLAGRVDAIKLHHDKRLLQVAEISKALGPATVEDFSHELFSKRHWGTMADSETFAHLEHLRHAGRAECKREQGQLVYTVHT
jgi:glyoxylase-like metal-dependent hydrolase (beta-lactamase superfamily II)